MNTDAISRRGVLAGLGASFMLPAMSARAGLRDRSVAAPAWGELTLLDADGREFRLDDTVKPFTLVKLWANWCGVCLRELDTFSQAAEQLSARAEVLLVSHPQDWARNQDIAQRRGITLRCARPSFRNAGSAIQAAMISADGSYYVPRSLLFSKAQNAVVWSHVGGLDWASADTTGPIRALVG